MFVSLPIVGREPRSWADVGESVRVLRDAAGLTIEALAGRSELTFPQVEALEVYGAGVGAADLEAIAMALMVPVGALLYGDETPLFRGAAEHKSNGLEAAASVEALMDRYLAIRARTTRFSGASDT